MVQITTWLCRVPVIKFRKGGLGRPSPPPAAATPAKLGSCPALSRPAAQPAQPAVSMSTIPDIDLPARYRRQPLSQEEIDHINGGGVEVETADSKAPKNPKMLGMIRIPKGMLVRGKGGAEAVSLNIILQQQGPRNIRRFSC